MIDFKLDEDETALRQAVREFGAKELAPRSRDFDTASRIEDAALDQLWHLELIQAQLDDGSTPLMNALALEELGASDASAGFAVGCAMSYVRTFARLATSAQKAQLAERLASARFACGALATFETGTSATGRPSTVAEKTAEGFIVSGEKNLVPFAAEASDFLVLALVGDDLGLFMVPRSSSGVSVDTADGTLGLRAAGLASVRFEGVVVPEENRLGGECVVDLEQLKRSANLNVAAVMVGLSRRVRDHVADYVKQRIIHGRPLAEKQTVAFTLADMHIYVESMRHLLWYAATMGEHDASKNAALASGYASRHAMEISDNGLQALGGHGYVQEHPLEMWYRDARTLSLFDGSTVG